MTKKKQFLQVLIHPVANYKLCRLMEGWGYSKMKKGKLSEIRL